MEQLRGIPETLLIPLWARAVETKRSTPIIKDIRAVEMVERIEYDFSKFDKAWMSQVGVAIRTKLLDQATMAFINKHPNTAIINIGAGLDSRFVRVDNGKIRWYELDLPESIRIRKAFFNETDRYKMIAKSIFDYSWIKEINTFANPVLIIAEGVLMYFEEDEVKSLMDRLVVAFPHAEMLFEMMTPTLARRSKQHDAVSKTDAEFRWGITSGKEMETLSTKIKFIEEWNYFNYEQERWRWMRWLALIPAFKNRFNNRIVHLRFI